MRHFKFNEPYNYSHEHLLIHIILGCNGVLTTDIIIVFYLLHTHRYLYDSWDHEQDSRDQYSATTAPASKSSKELPQLPNHYQHRQPQSQSQSPFASQSTVKEVSVSSSAVPSVVIAQHHDGYASSAATAPTVPSVSTTDALSSYGVYGGTASGDESFYDETTYNNHAQVDHSLSGKRLEAMVPVSTDQSEQYMDSYENQGGYEDWQNYGYYDESGNYISYDHDPYYDEKGNLVSAQSVAPTSIQEKDAYNGGSAYYDQSSASYDVTTGANPSVAVTTNAIIATTTTTTASATSGKDLAVVDSTSFAEQYEDASYYNNTGTDQEQYNGYDGNYAEGYSSYDQDGYWYEGSEAFDQPTTSKPSHPETVVDTYAEKPVPSHPNHRLESQSSVEYNFAYQSAENLSSYEPGKLEKSESISRRASFRRQTSTRGDYPIVDGVPPNHQFLDATPHLIPATSTTIGGVFTPTTTTTAPAPLTTTNAAAAAANKLTSEIKSALPQLSSLTKGKSDLLSSSFSKLGSFMSSAAAKTGVSVPLMTNKDPPKDIIPTPLANKSTGAIGSTVETAISQNDPSLDQGLGYSLDEAQANQFDSWNGHYDEQMGEYHEPYLEARDEPFDQSSDAHKDLKEDYDKGPVHMDSLESNVSEGAKDGEDLEAEYWQKQKERIAKQSSLATQESQDYYQYDPYTDNKANLLHSMDSTDDKGFERDEYNRQNSLDRDEWLRELEKQSGSRIRPTLTKKDTMSMSLDRSESIDQQTDYGDDYGTDQDQHDRRDRLLGQESLESADGEYPLSPPPSQKPPDDELDESGQRKQSMEIQPAKEKESKSVSFEEEPAKVVPERQTKGMTPREKWLWAMNRICAQLAVSSLLTLSFECYFVQASVNAGAAGASDLSLLLLLAWFSTEEIQFFFQFH
jgi:hypothetical protein